MRLEYTELEEAKHRVVEIQSVLENELYEDYFEEDALMKERDLLEEFILAEEQK